MTIIDKDSLATLEFELDWKSRSGSHKEVFYADHVNFWRDVFPERVKQALMGRQAGEHRRFSFTPGEMVLDYDPKRIFGVHSRQFQGPKINGHKIEPRFGRFYPKGLLKDLPNIFRANIEPFRCVGLALPSLKVDFNHPMAGKDMELLVTVRDVRAKQSDRGGRLMDWMETIAEGPGMQARLNGKATDFFSDNAFSRSDEQNDILFYEKARLVNHIDSKADEIIGRLYGQLLRPGMKVLDLMSSYQSHVPESLELASLVGLGMNKEEMEKNPLLAGHIVHDLNLEPRLLFDDEAFDAVICTVSVEYMTRPFEVFLDVARILRPNGYFIHTFSNRWFPPKVISIWQELSEFERMGLVLEYFLRTGAYENLETYSARGWPRPETDRYYPELMTADPVYAVWGQKVD